MRRTTRALGAVVDAAPPPQQQWHVRGGIGGTKTSLNTARAGLDGVKLEEALAVQRSVELLMPKKHPGVVAIEHAVEKAAVLRRDWTDEDFQEGEAGNERRVHDLESEFKAIYAKSKSLDDPVTLGMALDLVGVYLKNYKIAKAAAIVEDALPKCRKRGGVWLIKALNHASTVRMKQQRHAEALVMLRELESLIHFDPAEAVELYDMLYRNLGMALQALNKPEEALSYFLKCATIKGVATWWDMWDCGYCMATVAFGSNDFHLLRRAGATIADAVPLHLRAEPGEYVMHAKICQALADCYLALSTMATEMQGGAAGLDDAEPSRLETPEIQNAITVLAAKALPVMTPREYLEEAEKYYVQAHRLFTDNCGETNDLSGWCAAAAALCLVQLENHNGALKYLLHAIYVYSKSDIPKLPQLRTNLGLVTQCHNQLQDPALLAAFLPHLDTLLARLDAPTLQDPEQCVPHIKRDIGVIFATAGTGAHRDLGLDLLAKHL